jgi:arylformamidase
VSAEGAAWLVDQGVQLAGIDYLSIQRFSDPPDTHLIMLGAGIVILEGLNLQDVAPGPYELLCLPLRLHGTEAAPVRAVLRPL